MAEGIVEPVDPHEWVPESDEDELKGAAASMVFVMEAFETIRARSCDSEMLDLIHENAINAVRQILKLVAETTDPKNQALLTFRYKVVRALEAGLLDAKEG